MGNQLLVYTDKPPTVGILNQIQVEVSQYYDVLTPIEATLTSPSEIRINIREVEEPKIGIAFLIPVILGIVTAGGLAFFGWKFSQSTQAFIEWMQANTIPLLLMTLGSVVVVMSVWGITQKK